MTTETRRKNILNIMLNELNMRKIYGKKRFLRRTEKYFYKYSTYKATEEFSINMNL